MKIQKLPAFKRPRERLIESGVQSLRDIDLLAIILQSGYKNTNVIRLAQKVLSQGKLTSLHEHTYESLRKIKGIGSVRAATIVAIVEIAERLYREPRAQVIETTLDAIHHFAFIKHRKREHFVCIYLNARQQFISKEVISVGTLDASIVHPREVFAPGLLVHAASVIVGHNHPSGDPEPSHADLILTKRLQHAGKILGIAVIDHIIVADRGSASFKEMKII